ncbi:hypothetical protein LTR20_006355 [Exophiala xenobiotica]|nr:hypothetical protein LTS13_010998 [Exophiala xenobiotica]KAK5395201.1 hypothetical protein LTR79_007818 [Exophiala xenobiotica]KAK5412798.1 hypothetical protein LTR90_006919 [Exophiala xenobiotica]KAK5461432.1 hypothetical protein LTR20_006355 [Exophiala xenobiotica]KAK5482115.1 hypothetical protein LTR26_006448 [Exophiala xenobiotica]
MTGTTNNHAAVAYDDRSAGEAKHRGIMDAGGNVVVRCSKDYLTGLTLEILRARAFPLVKLTRFSDVSAQLQRLQLITVEVRRLFHNPELFPSEALRARFAAIVASDANLQFVQAVKHLLLRDANVSMIRFNRVNFTRRSYETGSKGWENFYFNMAPGAPTDKDTQEDRLQTSPQSSWQLIPIAGMRVIGDLVNEERILLQWIKDTSLPVAVQPALTTRILDLDKPEEQDPNPKNHLRQVTEEVHARPNPYYEDLKLRLDLPSHAPEPLEDFTPFVGRLESQPLPPNMPIATLNAPNLFSMISVRSWHRPARRIDLRFRKMDTLPQSQ